MWLVGSGNQAGLFFAFGKKKKNPEMCFFDVILSVCFSWTPFLTRCYSKDRMPMLFTLWKKFLKLTVSVLFTHRHNMHQHLHYVMYCLFFVFNLEH